MAHRFDPSLNRIKLANMVAAARYNKQPELLVQELWRDGLDYLAKRKSDNARRKQLENLWLVHIDPLKEERKRVVASLAYPNHNRNNASPRRMALKAYLTVLDELLRRMKREASGKPFPDRRAMTPADYVKAKNVPNNGEHWTDFVPVRIKQRVLEMFDNVPHTPKARRKVPFERIISSELHAMRKERLVRRTEKELRHAKQELVINPDSEEVKAKIDQIEEALQLIDKLEPHEPVPTTWQRLMYWQSL